VALEEFQFYPNSSPKAIARAFREFGCAIVRNLNQKYVSAIYDDVMALRQQTLLLYQNRVIEERTEGLTTPDGSLLIPMGKGQYDSFNPQNQQPEQKWQIMVLGLDYYSSSALLKVSIDEKVLDIVEAILEDPNIELFGKGQIVLKEPEGGHAKYFHQDAAYFEFKNYGPVGTFNYCVDTTLNKKNGVFHVFPGSHRLGYVPHVDTHSHLALPLENWLWEDSVAIEGNAGDCILFHQYMIHGSPNNYSKDPRPAFVNRYLQVDDCPIMPLATTVEIRNQNKQKIAAGEKVTKDMGYIVRGRRIFNPKTHVQSEVRAKQFH